MYHYAYEVAYSQHSSMMGNAATLDKAIEGLNFHVAYYRDMGYPIRLANVFVRCEACEGNGRVAKGRKGVRFPKYTDCKACKGKASFPLPLTVGF